MQRLTCALALTLAIAVATLHGEPPQPDLSSPAWLASYLPPAVLVMRPKQADRIQQFFQEGLTRLQAAKPARYDDFPAGQKPPKLIERGELDHPPSRSADVGFWVLISQTGRVVALFAAFSTNDEWTHNAALAVAKSKFQPAQLNGRPVPVLVPFYYGADHSVSIN